MNLVATGLLKNPEQNQNEEGRKAGKQERSDLHVPGFLVSLFRIA
jgi:hypothetical protein